MALILHIETSTNVCSVALSEDGRVLFIRKEQEGPSHASLIGPFIDGALSVAEQKNVKPDAVAVSAGPGSYTGLRIGVSAAKGICYALRIPLIAIPTLELMADTCRRNRVLPGDALIRPVMDARRMEVYTSLYDKAGCCLEPVNAVIADEHSFDTELSSHAVFFAGNGAAKLRAVIHSEKAGFDENLIPAADAMIYLAEKAYSEKQFVDVAYFEPFYLKDFVATVKKHLIPVK